MPPLPDDVRRALLELARRAIVAAAGHAPLPGIPQIPGLPPGRPGAFVTLRAGRRLRGCVGQMEGGGSLAETVVTCAVNAATGDPRFPPVTPAEVDALEIEISVLAPLEPIRAGEVQPGRHGLLVRRGRARGVLLPQVAAEQGWSAERFLEETCRKAGLPAGAWRDPDTAILAFTAEVFSEAELCGHSRRAG